MLPQRSQRKIGRKSREDIATRRNPPIPPSVKGGEGRFVRSLSVSLGVHLLVLASAFAFAQHGGSLFGQGFDFISVSLVGSGEIKGKKASKASPKIREYITQPASPAGDDAQDGVRKDREDDAGDGRSVQTDSVAEAGPGAGSGFGLVSPREWQLIQAAIERAKNYPRTARQRGIEGVVRVRFRLLPSGEVERVEVLQSSGHDVLDAASVRTVYRAGPLPYVNGWVEVPISYVLK